MVTVEEIKQVLRTLTVYQVRVLFSDTQALRVAVHEIAAEIPETAQEEVPGDTLLNDILN